VRKSLLTFFRCDYGTGGIDLVDNKSLLRLLLLAFVFAACAAVGILLSALTDETWLAPVGIGIGFIVCSAVGAYAEAKSRSSFTVCPSDLEDFWQVLARSYVGNTGL